MPTVYRFTVYNIQSDENQLSRRWGTLTGIKAAGGTPLMDTVTEADTSAIGREVEGLTERNF